jgi:hypothetical protein
MTETIGIPVAFVLLTILILWVVIGVKGKWWVKTCLISLTLYFSVGLWISIDGLLGWPTTDGPPQKFEIHWLLVKEPNKKTGDSGAIYMWASNVNANKQSSFSPFGSKKPLSKPRLYQLPYSRSMHEQTESILEKLKKGERHMATLDGEGQGGKEGEGSGKGREGEGKNGNLGMEA